MQERAVSTQTNTCINTSMESADSVDIDDSSDLQQEQSSRSRNSVNIFLKFWLLNNINLLCFINFIE